MDTGVMILTALVLIGLFLVVAYAWSGNLKGIKTTMVAPKTTATPTLAPEPVEPQPFSGSDD